MLASLLAQEATDVPPEPTAVFLLRMLFWVWFLVAAGVWVYRGYRRLTRPKTAPDEEPTLAVPTPPAAPATPATPATPAAPAVRRGPASPGGPASPTRATPVADDPPGAAARRGLFAPATPDTERSAAPAQRDRPRQTVAALLKGIAMPCDLVPIVSGETDPSGMRVAFSTTGWAAADVGRSVGDELERLGFHLRSTSDTQVEASRDDGVLLVTLHLEPDEVQREGRRAFTALPAGALVVEFDSV